MARQLFAKFNLNITILVVILMLGLFLRVVDINNIPKAIYGDGLTLVYDAYSISKTGHDQKGNFLPFIFEQGDHRPPGYVYATIPFVVILGPTVLSANAVSILSGLGIILLLYLLGKILCLEMGSSTSQAQRVGLVTALMACISPWDLSLSRGPFESHFALFCALSGVYSFFKAKQNPRWLILMSLGFGTSSLTYPTYGLTAPLMLILLFILYRKSKSFLVENRLTIFLSVLITITAMLSSMLIVHSGGNPTRVESINVFSRGDVGTQIIQRVEADRKLDTNPEFIKNSIHNHFWSYTTLVIENYIENFRPSFLLINGDGEPRHNPAETGQLYWATGILAILGIIFLYGKKTLALLLGWLLIAPVATAIISTPHALRDSLMVPPLLLLGAFGAEKIFRSKRYYRNLVLSFIIILYLVEMTFVMERFYFIAPNKFARFWSYPAKQATQIALEKKSQYDLVILSTRIDNMEFAYPVYAHLEPQKVIDQNKQGTMFGGYRFLKYDNVYIGSIPDSRIKEFIKNIPGSVLYIGPATEKNLVEIKDVLSGPDLLPDLVISEKNK